SRRRHTRFSRDWSSDVCSSDLAEDVARLAAVHVDDVDAALAGAHAQVGNEGELLAVRRPGEVALAAHEPGDAPRLAALDRDDEDVVVVARRLVAHGRSEEHTSELQSRENLV